MERTEVTMPESATLNDLQNQLQRLTEDLRSKFVLVLAVAERAKQIVLDPNQQERPDENPVTQALREIYDGRLQIRLTDGRFLRALKGRPEDTDIFPYRP